MALSDDVRDRYPEQVLVEATNPRDRAAGGIDFALLERACTSVEAYMATYLEEAYDSTVAIHVEIGSRCVVGLLKLWGSGSYAGSKEFWSDLRSECQEVRRVRSRARVAPYTTTTSIETVQTPGRKPWADESYFEGIHLDGSGLHEDEE